VTATVNGHSQSVNATFMADGSTAKITDANLIVATGATANGQDGNAVIAIVTDANGNLVSGQSVTFSAETGATITPTQGMTGKDGKATATVTSRNAGRYEVAATLNGKVTSKPTSFVADKATATISVMTVRSDKAVADGQATDAVQVK
ncbi:hypothetical protein GQQ22_00015, partial [Pantoea agglomerans]